MQTLMKVHTVKFKTDCKVSGRKFSGTSSDHESVFVTVVQFSLTTSLLSSLINFPEMSAGWVHTVQLTKCQVES